MEAKAIVAYVMCDEVVKNLGIQEDKQSKMNVAEVMTTGIIATLEYFGNIEKARRALWKEQYIPNMLSKSQLNRRLHQVTEEVWNRVLERLASEFEKENIEKEFVTDSFPLPTCKLARQNRTKLYRERKYLGYCAVKKEFYLGFKLHMISDVKGNPVSMKLEVASKSDIKALRETKLNLPENSRLYADKAYNHYDYEDFLVQKHNIHLQPIRKKNSKRKSSGFLEQIRKKKRRIIESAFSCIEKLMPRSIHAVTINGFQLKAMLFVLAYGFYRVAL